MADQKEILESIRDIISGKNPVEAPAAHANDDDVLDLTQMVNDDGSVTEIKPKFRVVSESQLENIPAEAISSPEPVQEAAAPVAAVPQTQTTPTEAKADMEVDILSEIDSILNDKPKQPASDEKVELELAEKAPQKIEIAEEFTPTPEVFETPEAEIKQEAKELATAPEGFEPPIVPIEEPRGNKMEDNNDTIISSASADAAKASISQLMGQIKNAGREANKVEAGAPFRSGATVEDLVIEMLTPMMKDWLDKNLPKLVNEIVSKEIQKLIPKD